MVSTPLRLRSSLFPWAPHCQRAGRFCTWHGFTGFSPVFSVGVSLFCPADGRRCSGERKPCSPSRHKCWEGRAELGLPASAPPCSLCEAVIWGIAALARAVSKPRFMFGCENIVVPVIPAESRGFCPSLLLVTAQFC